MKYFIQIWMILLSTFSLQATEQYANDIIVPEYFSSNKDSSFIQEEITNNYIDNTVQSTNDIIVPESFKNNKETSITNMSNNISEEPAIIQTSSKTDIDSDIPTDDYTGFYKFERGTTGMKTMTETLHDGFLVIEKLDENDFGFYYVIQKKDQAPTDRYGIFHYKEGRFFQKFIGDPILRDNIEVKKLNIELETIIKDDRGEHAIQWLKGIVDDISMLNQKLQTSLKNTKENYRQIYKEKFIN